jgi:DNA ligase (NAD+)
MIKMYVWGEKSDDNLIDAIEKSKNMPLERLLFALGIRYIGEGAAKILARNFKDMSRIAEAGYDDITAIHEIGSKMTDSIVQFFADEKEKVLVAKLRDFGLNMEQSDDVLTDESKFNSMTFVLTGELTSMTRKQAKQSIELLGGKVTGFVSKRTDYVVVGDKPGSKLKKANELGVKIINEKEFFDLLND